MRHAEWEAELLVDVELDFDQDDEPEEPASAGPIPTRLDPCGLCGGDGLLTVLPGERRAPRTRGNRLLCPNCDGIGWLGIDPVAPTSAACGSALKVAVLAARYRNGVSLHHPGDACERA